VIGIGLAVDHGYFIVRKQFIPATAPNVIVRGIGRQPRRCDLGVVPQQVRDERLIGDLPDLPACLGKDHDAQKTILEHN
jgi:hypothetical protein